MRVQLSGETVDRILVTVAALIVLGSLVLLVGTVQPVGSAAVALHLMFLVTIALSENWRVRIPNSRELAPLAVASSVAFAVTAELPQNVTVTHVPGLVIVGTALASFAGHALYARTADLPMDLSLVATRVIVVALAAMLARTVPYEGATLVDRIDTVGDDRWWVALALFVVAGLAIGWQILLMSVQRSARTHAILRRAFLEEATAVGPLAAATTSTAVVVALAVGTLGPIAVPLFLIPLMLLNLAVARQAGVRTAQRQTIFALSRLTDLSGYTSPGHAARVADYSVAIGRDMGMSERELVDLQAAALLHDLGQVSLRRPIPGGATLLTSPLDQRRIAAAGAAILSRTAELSRLATVVQDQAVAYRRTTDTGIVSLASRTLKVANAFDDLVGPDREPEAVRRATQRLRLSAGYEYDPLVFRSLCRVLQREGLLSGRDVVRLDV
ncbi:HD-GYP domain-containing protein [Ornithinicoccus hortensis]|uniref:HD domain-containing protein n=1 Tax=Ornithinicoccus hortensis TaxID=82346 RepID=A0A542YQ64_9MICO|nr:HD domain-containing phosphohydrolase [Ornithinicoccus hortensis]TQL50199.1 HD domain-containing protein [Ornithinicoccus hortensis]